MLPSEFQEVQGYPNLKRLLEAQVDMQFVDLRALFRLPLSDIEGGCNFAASAVLFNIIAGSSVCFYEPSVAALNDRRARGKRFKEVLEKFYPWGGEPISKDLCVLILYDSARNPLTHSLGLEAPPMDSIGKQFVLKKWPLGQTEILELEDSPQRPDWAGATITSKQMLAYGTEEVVISVPSLYWGVHRMLHSLFSDRNHATKADNLAKEFSLQWDKYVSEKLRLQEEINIGRICDTCGSELISTDGGQSFECPQC